MSACNVFKMYQTHFSYLYLVKVTRNCALVSSCARATVTVS